MASSWSKFPRHEPLMYLILPHFFPQQSLNHISVSAPFLVSLFVHFHLFAIWDSIVSLFFVFSVVFFFVGLFASIFKPLFFRFWFWFLGFMYYFIPRLANIFLFFSVALFSTVIVNRTLYYQQSLL